MPNAPSFETVIPVGFPGLVDLAVLCTTRNGTKNQIRPDGRISLSLVGEIRFGPAENRSSAP